MVTNFGIGTLGPRPALGYSASQLDRAVDIRSDDAALKRCCEHAQAGTYVIGGELVVLKANNDLCQPLFSQIEARTLGAVREVADAIRHATSGKTMEKRAEKTGK